MNEITVRTGSLADFDAVLALMDDAVAWLVGQERTGQWGREPMSGTEKRRSHFREEITANDLWMAEVAREPVGAMLLGTTRMPYIDPVNEPEIYIHLLVSSSAHRGAGIGRALVQKAISEAEAMRVGLLRVDCYAGDDQKLVSQYERLGFTRVAPFTVGEWPGMLLAMRIAE
ncbi:MAG TPA: GNAT family N-acetyltransferase [Thermomicrobiales bacterium]|nr:GNAT family N-acetyltransferase [Thermomicrobiales bacterium]